MSEKKLYFLHFHISSENLKLEKTVKIARDRKEKKKKTNYISLNEAAIRLTPINLNYGNLINLIKVLNI